MPTKRSWCGDAVDRPQIDIYEFTENAVNVLAEGSDLAAVINEKRIPIELPAAVEDLDTEAPGDTGGVPAILQAIEAAINSSTIPEFAELVAAVENRDDDPESPYYRLSVTTREEFIGQPFELELDAPNPTIDIDVIQEGGPGRNEIQRFWISPLPDDGAYRVRWNLGSGLETSGEIPAGSDAETIKAAMIAGMASLTPDNVSVSGTATQDDPCVVELLDDLAETNVDELTIDVSGLTGNGEVTIVTTQQGGEPQGSSQIVNDTFTDTNGTLISAHTSDSAHAWTHAFGDNEPTIESNKLQFPVDLGSQFIGSHISADLPTDVQITGKLKLNDGGFGGQVNGLGFLIRYTDDDHFLWAGLSQTPRLVIQKYENGAYTQLAQGGQTHASNVEYNVTVTVSGDSITVESELDSISATTSYNATGVKHGVFCICANPSPAPTIDDFQVNGIATSNEVWNIHTNGAGGTFTLTKPGGSTTAGLSPGSTTAQIKTALEGIYGGTFTVTGSGVPGDPWEAEAGGALAGTNQQQPTGDGTNLTGGFEATVETDQDGSPPLPTIWDVTIHNASSGNFQFGFKGRSTTDIALGATAATVKAAFDALAPGDFTDLFTVVDTGIGDADYRITTAGRLSGEAQTLIAHNEDLVGTAQEINHYTLQAATGRHWIDNPTNWKDVATGLRGLPEDGDELFVQTGNESNSIRYGALTGIALKRFIKSSLFSGEMGLPERTETGYVEYRETAIPLEFEDGTQSFENPNVLIGVEQGQGSGLVRIKTGSSKVHIRVERTGGPAEEGRPSFCWDGQNANNTLELIEGYVGTAVFAFATASLARCVQRGGLLRFGEGTAIGAGGFDRVNGETVGRCTVGGVPLILGG